MISTYPWKSIARFLYVPGMLFLAAFAAPGAYAQQQQQNSGYAPESLFIALFQNGDALVEYDVAISDPLAEEIRITLFGTRGITNLIVVDYEDRVVDYEIGSSPNEIVLKTPGVSNVRISYAAQDLADRTSGRWTFALNSAISFTVKLPAESVLVDFDQEPTIKLFGDQYLLTFEPGNARVVYVIGVLGTEEQANLVIRAAETTIKEVRDRYPGIVLTGVEGVLQQAMDARDERRFADAERLADQANDAAAAAGRDFEAAQKAIADARVQIGQAEQENRDTAAAAGLMEQANAEFASGNYARAITLAGNSVAAIGALPPEPEMPLSVIVGAVVAAAGGIGALVFLKMRKPAAVPVPPRRVMEEPKQQPPAASRIATPPARQPVPEVRAEVEELEEEADLDNNNSNNINGGIPAMAGIIPDSQIDKTVLGRIVLKIMEERPHLRPEDQQVLKYLAEKEGAAFESEIRSKFQLPKTTIWRLVKRLEREELVEIRKAGGQNLIKLKFEDRQGQQ